MRIVAAIAGLLILAASPALWSQEPETNVQALESLAPEMAADFDERIALVIAKRKDAERIESQLTGAEGLQEQIIGRSCRLIREQVIKNIGLLSSCCLLFFL